MSGMLPVKGLYAFIYTLEAPWWAQAVCVKYLKYLSTEHTDNGVHISLYNL